MQKTILITGGAGFIGSHVVRRFVVNYPDYYIINLDALTYAGNLKNIEDIENHANYQFIHGDITDGKLLEGLFEKHSITHIIHLAAESHVDRSIENPLEFVKTNVMGTVELLEVARRFWKDDKNHLFYHVSTDEVYGSLGKTGLFTEQTAYDPNSPYSASKASSDHFVRAYGETYGIPFIISNCSNNYGPHHYPEKLIPLFIKNIIDSKPLPVYGDGNYTRDWLYVEDHARAIDLAFHKGTSGETYNIGGHNEWTNMDLVHLLCDVMDEKLNRENGTSRKLIAFVKDRPGHDLRYAIDASKIQNDMGWKPDVDFEQGLRLTVDWFLQNPEWLQKE
ncbi:dTDP-glucose 4,6-dehydratase [Nonlabens antarcticus]|uniref:dTDP-glucose 4,6-dehydratase n=1 Tax=Nonlabens antarcticus TaxID=392714 RepID=UPI001891BC27|nr:dTDP-glucose 4,6-dehydratase [Nonlabens antarcticus]